MSDFKQEAMHKPGKIPLTLLSALLLFFNAACKGQVDDDESKKAVITVGSRVVTLKDYNDALKRLLPEDTTDVNSPDLSVLKNDLVNQLIEEELLLMEAQRLSLTVTNAELSAEIGRIQKASGDDAFKDAVIERYGDMETWEAEIKRKLLVKKTIDAVIGARLKAAGARDNGDALRYYRGHIADYTVTEQAHARMIVVAGMEEAEKIRKGLTPQNFAAAAKEFSLSPEKDRGGDLGFFSRGDMPKEFEDAVFKLKPGAISPIVKTDYGYHIFYLEEKRRGNRLPFEEVREKITQMLMQERSDKEVADWMAELKKKTRISVKEGML